MNIDWLTPSGRVPAIEAHDIHVWAASMSEALVACPTANVLTADEKARARNLSYHEKCRFISGRLIVRNLLAEYLGVRPNKIAFKYTKNGKPILNMRKGKLYFNMAHSGDLALVAIGKNCFLGVDVEECRHSEDLIEIARCFFSKTEVATLESCSEAERETLFFRYWTAKEAYIKAYGGRICDSALKRLRVCCGAAQQILRIEPQRELRWLLPSKRFLAALAYHVRCDNIFYYKWKV